MDGYSCLLWVLAVLCLWGLFGYLWCIFVVKETDEDDKYEECPYE